LVSDTEFSRFELNFEILDAVENEVEADVESPARSEVPHGLIKSIASIKEFSMEKSHLNNDSFFLKTKLSTSLKLTILKVI
jgi:hypothetical protein